MRLISNVGKGLDNSWAHDGWLSVVRSRMHHVALAQRSANVRGFRDVGKTLAQLVSAGWV